MPRGAVAFLPAAAIGQRDAVIAACGGEAGVQSERKFEFGEAIVETAGVEIDTRQPEMRPGIFAVGMNGGKRRALRNREHGCRFLPSHVGAERMAGSQDAERLSILRVD